MTLKLYNTLTRKVEEFKPLHPPQVTMYNCGPTVYNYAHIGNLRAYVFADVLRRTLEMSGYQVRQIVNITDVGHLVSDADEGEDKMVMGAKREGKSVEDIIELYSDAFYDDLKALNILPAAKYPRASAPEYIAEQKKLVETLNKKGFLYTTGDGIYFDTSKFPRYADFAKLDVAGMQAGARVDVGEKKHPTDFAVWKFSPKESAKREQEWDSPMGIARKGFPGWHVECSAIAMKELGETIDIHTGGVDHIPVHHTNEIAQSECATGKQFARFWLHSAHMTVDGQKMSKSLGNTYRLSDLAKKGISPLAYRYWLLTASYRTQVNFTWKTLEGAQKWYEKMCERVRSLGNEKGTVNREYVNKFLRELNDDLNVPHIWGQFNYLFFDSTMTPKDKRATILEIDRVLGLGFDNLDISIVETIKITEGITVKFVHNTTRANSGGDNSFFKFLFKYFDRSTRSPDMNAFLKQYLIKRYNVRQEKDFAESDRLREEIRKLGYEVKDTPEGQELTKLS